MFGWILGFSTALGFAWLHEYPCETEPVGWRRKVIDLAVPLGVSERWVRSLGGVDIPQPPPFGRVLFNYMLPGFQFLPGTSSLELLPSPLSDDVGGREPLWLSLIAGEGGSWLSSSSTFQQHPPQYQFSYVCTDSRHRDYTYFFSYDGKHVEIFTESLWEFSHMIVFEALVSAMAYFAILLLLNLDLRRATFSSVSAWAGRIARIATPRTTVAERPIEDGDMCPVCHEELVPAGRDGAAESQAHQCWDPCLAWRGAPTASCGGECDGSLVARRFSRWRRRRAKLKQPIIHCRWSCGRAVHRDCQAQWLKTGANSCVYCNAPWV